MRKSFTEQQPPNSSTHDVDAQMLADIEGGDDSMSSALVVSGSNLPSFAVGNVAGDIDQSDLILPRLNLVQGVGPLSANFTPGDFVLNKDMLIAGKDTPIGLVVLSIRKYYEENLPYDANGPRAKTFANKAELVAANLHVEWRGDVRPPAREVADLLVLIKKPDSLTSTAFSITVGGAQWAIAAWTVRATAYRNAAKFIFSKMALELSQVGILGGMFEMHSQRIQVGGNYTFAPFMRLVSLNSPEMIAELNALSRR